MKLFLIFSVLALSYFHLAHADPCSWSRNVTATINKLTPSGKTAAKKILADLNVLVSAAVPPIWNTTITQYLSKLASVTNQNKLMTLRDQFCNGNTKCWIQYLTNYCASYSKTVGLVASFSSSDQQIINQVLQAFAYNTYLAYPIIASINQYFDASQFASLTKTEKQANLATLTALYNTYGQ